MLKAKTRRTGYKEVYLSLEGVMHGYLVHRLVAQVFIPNPDNKPQVNHIDGMPDNNWVDNLEWCTAMENTHHSMKNGKRQINMPKITQEKLIEIKTLLDAGWGRNAVCRQLKVSPGTLIKFFGKIN